jgi:hypothetical protein
MMYSNDVAQMFAAQGQMFMGQNAYAQQIGVSPPSFSYNPGGAFGGGHGPGNRFAGGAMAAAGGIATVGAGMAFDPFGAFLGGAMGGMARGGLGAALGGGMMAAAPMIPIAMAAQAGIGGLMRGGQQQAAIAQNLNSFQFMNPMARSGQGFSRDDAKAIGDQVRALAHIPEMMTSVEELTRMMPRLKASGVMQGVRSAAEFSQRFKEAVSTIRDMSKVLGSTMEEAEQFFAQSRSMGFIGRGAQLRNALNAQFTAAQTGMDVGQVMNMQMSGANMARSVGGRGAQGAAAISSIAQRIEAGRQAGRISEEMLQDVSGQGGALGVQGAAERMYGLMLNMRNTAAGRLVMAGAMKRDENGKVVLDENIIRKFNSGALGIEDLKRRASNLSNDDKISFAFRAQGSLGSQLAGSLDAGHMMQGLVGGKGRDAAALVLQRYTGGNEQDIDMMMGLGSVGGSDAEVGQFSKLRARQANFRDRTDPSAIMKRLGTRIHSSTIGHIESAGAKIYSEIGKSFDSVMDEFLGRAVATVSKDGADSLAKAMAGGSKEDLKRIIAQASGLKERGAAAGSIGGMDLLAAGTVSGQLSLAQKLARSFRNTDVAAFLMRGDSDTGRSMEAQAAFTREITGGAGLTDAARMRQANLLNAGMTDAGGAGSVVKRLRAEIENFRGMDDERKLVELRSSIQSQIVKGAARGAFMSADHTKEVIRLLSTEGSGSADEYLKSIGIKGGLKEAINKMETSDDPAARDAAKLLRTGLSAQQQGASDVLTGIISATQGKFAGGESQINIAKALRMSGDVDIKQMIEQSQREMKSAASALTGAADLSEGEASVITANPEARKALKEALNPASSKHAAVRAALDIPDADAAAKALNALGYAVKASDIDAMKKVQDKGDAGAAGVIQGAILAYEKGEAVSNYSAISSAAKNKAKEIAAAIERTEGLSPEARAAAKAVQAKLEEFGNNLSAENMDALRESIGSLTDRIAAGGDGAAGLVSATGDIGTMVQDTVEQAKGLRKKKGRLTQEDVIKAFGLGNDDATKRMLDAAGVAGGVGSANVDIQALTKKVAAFKASGVIARKDQAESGAAETGEQKLLDTLGKIDKTLDRNTAALTLAASGWGSGITKETKERALAVLNETGAAPQTSSNGVPKSG